MGGGARVITLRYYAAARAAAGVVEEQVAGPTLAEALAVARRRHGEQLDRVLQRCSFLVDGQQARPSTPLADGAVVEVLPPFAGG
jgi:sulfur-carrier protein